MNERIFELAKQADLIQWDTLSSGAKTPDHVSVVKARKFAELIVRECAAALFDESERLSGLYSDEDNWDSAEEYEIRSNQCIDDIALIENILELKNEPSFSKPAV
jgi:hypothetical protein